MTKALQEDIEVIETVRWFANLETIESTKQVEDKFSELASDRFQVIFKHEVQAYEKDQRWIKEQLQSLVEGDSVRPELMPEINEMVSEFVHPKMNFIRGEIKYSYQVDGVQAACSLALALLMDRDKDLLKYFKRCLNPECGKFNFTPKPKGKVPSNCRNGDCKRKADNVQAAERQKKSRCKE